MSFAPQTKLPLSDLTGKYTYSDIGRHSFGLEYMGGLYAKLRANPALNVKITLRGDSTINGNGASTQDYQPPYILPIMLARRGVACTTTNGGVGGKTSADWVNTYLAIDLAGTQPDVYVLGYIQNDAQADKNITPAQCVQNFRTGMAILRATWSVAGTAVIIKSNNASFDALGRTEAYFEAVAEGIRRVCREYGCAFADTYAQCPEARQNLPTNWLDVVNVHGNEDHYMVDWGPIADLIVPRALQDMLSRPLSVTPAASFTAGSDPLKTVAEGRLVSAGGFLNGPSTIVAAGVTLGTIGAGHRPLTLNYFVSVIVWSGATPTLAAGWQSLHVMLNTNGTIVTMEASTLVVARVVLDGLVWRRS